jgi:hypothetical protein
MDRPEAQRRLDDLRGLKIRRSGNWMLQAEAWKIAEQLGWSDTYLVENVALIQLQTDAFMTDDAALAEAVCGRVVVVSSENALRL